MNLHSPHSTSRSLRERIQVTTHNRQSAKAAKHGAMVNIRKELLAHADVIAATLNGVPSTLSAFLGFVTFVAYRTSLWIHTLSKTPRYAWLSLPSPVWGPHLFLL